MSTQGRARSLSSRWLLALGLVAMASPASAQGTGRVLLLWDGAPDAAANARVRERLAREPGVESVSVAAAPLGEILLAAGCVELPSCAPRIARAARADLLVVRTNEPDASLQVVDPERPERARTIEDAGALVPSPAPAQPPSPQPLTWALGGASLALFTGAAIAGGLSLATQDEYARLRTSDAGAFETYALLARGQSETTAAGVLLGVGIATAITTIVMLAFDLKGPPADASLALVPVDEGARAEARWWF